MEPGKASSVFTMLETDTYKAMELKDWMIVKVVILWKGGVVSDLCLGGLCLGVPPQLHRR